MSTTLEEARANLDALLERRDALLKEIERVAHALAQAMQDVVVTMDKFGAEADSMGEQTEETDDGV